MGEPVVTTYQYDHAGRIVRTETSGWTGPDREAVLALLNYEAGLCPGCNHPLAETTRVEHTAAYRPEPPIRCHFCTTQAAMAKTQSEDEKSPGLLYSISLDAAVVELNSQPIPPLPPELAG